MKILFLPNFKVKKFDYDDPSVPSPNKSIKNVNYWFFKYFPDTNVDIIDNSSPFPFSLISKYLKLELFQAIKAFLKYKKYDIIISHSYNSGFFFSLFRSILGISKPPHVIIDIGCLNGGRENVYQIYLLKFALKSVSGIICHSTINLGFYKRHVGYKKYLFTPFGTDPDFFKPFAYPSEGKFALSIGYAKRDYITLIDSWSQINYPLKIIGKTDLELRNRKNIELIPNVSIEKLKEYIHDSKIVILPIADEPYSVGQMTLTQCMSMEKAVIVTNVPGTRDYVEDNCITIGYKSNEDLTEKVNHLLSNESLINDISHRARISILKKYNEKQMAEHIFNFLKEIVEC